MHRLRPLRWLAFIVGLGIALAIAGAGTRTGRGLEVVGGWSSDGTCYWPDGNRRAPEGATLELVDVFEGCESEYLIAGEDEGGRPLFSGSHQSDTKPVREIAALLYDADGNIDVRLDNRWAICPTGARWPEPEAIVWWPESWYEPTNATTTEERIQLFRRNYAKEFKLIYYDHRMRALRHAARGESLAVYTRLLVTVPGEEERLRIPVDPMYTAEGGMSFTDGESRQAVLVSDGGYHNSDTFYMLFAQESSEGSSDHTLLGITDIEGGYRGAFSVDLETGETLWRLRTGVTCVRAHVADLNGDGLDEFLVQCYCSENGVSGGGTTDAGTCYVLCLDQSGNILWKRRFVGVHIGATAAIADVTGDARPEVVVACSSTRDNDMGYAAVLSGDGQTLHERSDLGGLYGIAVADFLGTGKSQMVTGGPDAVVHLLDGELDVVSTFRDTADFTAIPNWASRKDTIPDIRATSPEKSIGRLVPFAAFDYDGDGDIETLTLRCSQAVVSWTPHERNSYQAPRSDLVILDSGMLQEGRETIRAEEWGLWRSPHDTPASLKSNMYPVDMDGDGVKELVLSNDKMGLFVFKVVDGE